MTSLWRSTTAHYVSLSFLDLNADRLRAVELQGCQGHGAPGTPFRAMEGQSTQPAGGSTMGLGSREKREIALAQIRGVSDATVGCLGSHLAGVGGQR